MAANPKPKDTPEFNPRIGEGAAGARPTIPMARRALSEETQLLTRDHCWRCAGTGFVDRPYIQCDDPHCGKSFTDEQVARHLGSAWRWKRLPCGHPLPGGEPTFLSAQCQTCGGGGWLNRWITLGVLLDFFETLYPENISAEITARRKATF